MHVEPAPAAQNLLVEEPISSPEPPLTTELTVVGNPGGTFDVVATPSAKDVKPTTLARCKSRGIAGLLVKALCEASGK